MNLHRTDNAAGTTAAATLDIDELPLPYVEIDTRGIIIRANRAALALQHPEQGELVGMSAWDLMASDQIDCSSAAFQSLMASGGDPPVITRSLFDRTGSFRTYEMHRKLIRDADGRPAGIRMICVDVTDARKMQEEARREVQWLTSVVQSFANAVILTDILGIVRSVNRAAEELFGFTAQELNGKVIEETVPMLEYESLDGIVLNRRTAIERSCKGIATLLVRGSRRVRVEMNTSPILDKESGSVSGVAAILREIDGVQP